MSKFEGLLDGELLWVDGLPVPGVVQEKYAPESHPAGLIMQLSMSWSMAFDFILLDFPQSKLSRMQCLRRVAGIDVLSADAAARWNRLAGPATVQMPAFCFLLSMHTFTAR